MLCIVYIYSCVLPNSVSLYSYMCVCVCIAGLVEAAPNACIIIPQFTKAHYVYDGAHLPNQPTYAYYSPLKSFKPIHHATSTLSNCILYIIHSKCPCCVYYYCVTLVARPICIPALYTSSIT